MPVTAVSDMAANQLTWVSTIPAFGGLVWYNARAGISSGWHLAGITNVAGVFDSELISITLITFYHINDFSSK